MAVSQAPAMQRPPRRWVCPCRQPPVLLATASASGTLNLKFGDRYYHVEGAGRVRATCPRCGQEHTITFASATDRPSADAPADPTTITD